MAEVKQRPIRFRAWDRDNSRMCEVKSLHLGTGKVNVAYRGSQVGLPDRYGGNYNIAADTLMQYTGMDDKNGTPIFERDIVEYHNGSDVIRTLVEFDINFEGDGNVFAGFLFDQSYNSGAPFDRVTGEYFEVIGNLYQNGDLLNA